MKANQTNNNHNWPVCPAVLDKNGKPLTGSIKRNVLEGMRPYVEATCHLMGFEYAEHHFKTKADTLIDFLKRGESVNKTAITENQITRNRIYALDEQVNKYVMQLEGQSLDLDDLTNRHYQLTDIIRQGYEAQAILNSILAKAVQSQAHIMSNFTERISAADRREVNPTSLITESNSIKRIKAGPTSQVGRRFVSNNKRTGKLALPGPGTQSTLRSRYEQSKSRRRGRV